jgi:hypothetical protein
MSNACFMRSSSNFLNPVGCYEEERKRDKGIRERSNKKKIIIEKGL